MNVQRKTAVLFTIIMATILLLLSWVVYFFTYTFAFNDFYKRLEIRAYIAARAKLEKNQTSVSAYNEIRQEHLELLLDERESFARVDSLSYLNDIKRPIPESFIREIIKYRIANYRKGDIFYTGIVYNDGKSDYVVVTSARNAESVHSLNNLKKVLIFSCLAAILIAYTTGIFFSRHMFKPVRDIIEKVKNISVKNLHLRLEVKTGEDEISVLASTFNEMLSRLETSFETQNNFVSNASHELRTPLTAIYGEADIALARDRSADEYKQALQVILLHAEKLQKITDSLLNLAQTGLTGKTQNWEKIRIDELVMEIKDMVDQVIPDNKVKIDLSALPDDERKLTILGNYQLLKLGLSNVVFNACKYSDNKEVNVRIQPYVTHIKIITEDKGIGIPVDELKFIFDPFFRASNTGHYKGYGIGLPLTRNIMRLHKGDIQVVSAKDKGATVTLTIPYA